MALTEGQRVSRRTACVVAGIRLTRKISGRYLVACESITPGLIVAND